MTDDVFESRLARFEADWLRDGPRRIADYLDDSTGSSSADRTRLLVELIAIDLEFRWRIDRRDGRSAERLLLEDYGTRFPELGDADRWSLELIGEEYRVRRRWGDRPSHEEVLSRFATRREEILAELRRIDGELEAESAEPRPILERERGSFVGDEPPEGVPGVPWLSHSDFLLRRLIGAGRMGKVYEASQQGTRRKVAVKFLRKTLLQEPEIMQRFIGEARTVARLRHPSIVGVQGLGRTGGGSYFIVMDLVNGPDLAQIARSRPIAVAEALRWTAKACAALEHAHASGVTHCDLKPANLLLDADGSIRVTDFGLARSLTGHTDWTAEIEGTAPFMAPEQVSRCWGRIDQQTDVYGIGAVLFALLTGRPPHVGRRLPDILADVVSATPVVSLDLLRPDLPAAIVTVCRKCLAKPLEERYVSVREVRAVIVDQIGYDVAEHQPPLVTRRVMI
jgi:eukaryotic-like serine/threonine-protein kinase